MEQIWAMVVLIRARVAEARDDERGMTTAELLGNAALGIAVLVALWAALRALGLNVITWIGQQIGVG